MDPVCERCRRETPHADSHTDTQKPYRLMAIWADMLHTHSDSHCPAGHTNRMDWPKGSWVGVNVRKNLSSSHQRLLLVIAQAPSTYAEPLYRLWRRVPRSRLPRDGEDGVCTAIQ